MLRISSRGRERRRRPVATLIRRAKPRRTTHSWRAHAWVTLRRTAHALAAHALAAHAWRRAIAALIEPRGTEATTRRRKARGCAHSRRGAAHSRRRATHPRRIVEARGRTETTRRRTHGLPHTGLQRRCADSAELVCGSVRCAATRADHGVSLDGGRRKVARRAVLKPPGPRIARSVVLGSRA